MSGDNTPNSAPTAPAAPTAPTAPAAPAAPGDAPPNLFPHVIAPDVDNSAPSDNAPGPATVTPEQFEQLQSSFNTFREESQQREQGLQQTIQTLMMRPAAVAPAAPAAPAGPAQTPGLDLSGLPDPVSDPTKYHEALQGRIADAIVSGQQTNQQALLSQVSSAQAINGLWSRIQGEHPELAKRTALLQGAAAVEFGNLRAQGIDPIVVASQNPDSLIGNIVARMTAELGTAPAAPGAAGAAPAAPGSARAESVSSGSQPTAPTAPTAPKATSFVQQLKETQRRDGLI